MRSSMISIGWSGVKVWKLYPRWRHRNRGKVMRKQWKQEEGIGSSEKKS
jgi:hypothetical protein